MNEKEAFNNLALDWNRNIPKRNYEVIKDLLERIDLSHESNVLDVGAGTGILYNAINEMGGANYTGLDISEGMLTEFIKIHPEADVRCIDFDKDVMLERAFDYIIIFNSIPHFNDLKMVFQNAYNNLKIGGKFIIAHSKTRQGLLEHHLRIGYKSKKTGPIPLDETLIDLSNKYNFKGVTIEDIGYFYYCAAR